MTPAELRQWREAHDLTQSDLAALLGLSDPARGGQVTVSRWERGRKQPPPYLSRALRDIAREMAESP